MVEEEAAEVEVAQLEEALFEMLSVVEQQRKLTELCASPCC